MVRSLPASARRRTSAFTLIEVMLVVVMLGIAGVLVIPSMSQTNVLRVQSTVRTLVADIAFLQSDAVAYQSRRAIVFGVVPRKNPDSGTWEFVAGNGYTLAEVRGASLDLATDALIDPDDSSRPFGRDFSEARYAGAVLSNPSFNGDSMLIFDELGGPVAELQGPDAGNGGSVRISGSGAAFRVDIQAYTGRVRVTKIADINDPEGAFGGNG
ncbi:MAG: hypothetical protein JNK58_09420 [Phycisphaerae bacterium]|nr:hypothetical protein [Phycisphaerae bacterium]